MAHFLGAELTKELENLNADVNTNDNSEAQQNQETNTQDNEKIRNANDKTTDEEIKPEWVNVSRIKRYKASIAAENIEGDTFAKKVTNVNKKISHVDDFMGSRIVYIQNKAHVGAIYRKKVSMEKACDIKLFDDNDF